MKYLRIIFFLIAYFFGFQELKAQEAIVASAGTGTGSGGTAIHSVGQVFYAMGSNGTIIISPGVLQPKEISTITGIIERAPNIFMNVFPNPTTSFVTLYTEYNEGLSYILYDLLGRVVDSKIIHDPMTIISFEDHPKAGYILAIKRNNQILRTFKIFKH